MPERTDPQIPEFSPGTLAGLACPACLGDLLQLHAPDQGVACIACGRVYPMIDGIPVLIAERATEPEG